MLPIRMFVQLSGIMGYFSAAANYFDFVLHIVGMVLIVFSRRGKIRSTGVVNFFVGTIGFLLAISFTMSLLLYKTLGTLDGETSLDAIVGPTIYYVQYIFIVLYNVNIFRLFTVQEIDELMQKMIKAMLVLGYVQILICIGIGGVDSLYNGINILGTFQPAEYIQEIERIPLTGSEPAVAGWLIGLFVYPYLLSKIITSAEKRRYVWQILAWLPVVYFTKSSTCFILVACNILMFIFLFFRNSEVARTQKVMLISVSIMFIGVILVVVGDLTGSPVLTRIRYLLFEKSTDGNNESTVTRIIPSYINFRIFLRYPLFGIGNGNQGFFYKEFFPAWGDISSYTYGKIVGVADGGVFIPSLFSGYGIVGVFAFSRYAISHVKLALREKVNLGSLYYMFIMAAMAFLINGFQGDYFGQYLPLFVMCIPFMGSCCKPAPAS